MKGSCYAKSVPGCTIGAKIFEPGNWYVLFKNKDFKRESLEDELLVDKDVLGIRGMESWAATNGETKDIYSGLSLGINGSGLFCADANIKTLSSKKNYDILTEHVLRNAAGADEAKSVLSEEIKKGYGWTNLVVVDGRETVALEVGDKVQMERSANHVSRTNHFLLTPDWKVDYHQDAGTKTRMADAAAKIEVAENLDDIFDLLRTHRSRSGATSVCNHQNLHTVYSYVFERKNGRSRLYVAQGNPCKNEYVEIGIPFPITQSRAQEILEAYPSKATRKMASRVPVVAKSRV